MLPLAVILGSLCFKFSEAGDGRKNIVFVLTDNQDVVLGGFEPMRHTQKLVADEGMTFTNAFVSTPVCCPSRSTFLTGKYPHNHRTFTNKDDCNSEKWRNEEEPFGYAKFLEEAGYETLFAGKYLNRYGLPDAGGLAHIPVGWTHWRALVGNSVYYNYTLSVDGKAEVHGDKYEEDYLTDVVRRKAESFLLHERDPSKPFMLCLSTPAPHDPETPAPKYRDEFAERKAPRTKAFNVYSGHSKHWLTRMAPESIPDAEIELIDEKFRNKWRSLLSVDDMVQSVVSILEKQGILDDTYIIFTSDHGFHLGQFTLPFDMRHPYEFDIRIPLVMRGPGIPKNVTNDGLVVSVDFAPTFLAMANLKADHFDGISMMGDLSKREGFLVEYKGEGGHKRIDEECVGMNSGTLYGCYHDYGCKCVDSSNNTYACIRKLSSTDNFIFCEFFDDEHFEEYYDLNKDPDQLINTAAILDQNDAILDPAERDRMTQDLAELLVCAGLNCSGKAFGTEFDFVEGEVKVGGARPVGVTVVVTVGLVVGFAVAFVWRKSHHRSTHYVKI